MESFFSEQRRLLATLSDKKRYLYHRIDWGLPCIGILGARGTGKTTLMLQSIKKRFGKSDKGLKQISDVPDSYVVADDMESGFGRKIPLWLFGFMY